MPIGLRNTFVPQAVIQSGRYLSSLSRSYRKFSRLRYIIHQRFRYSAPHYKRSKKKKKTICPIRCVWNWIRRTISNLFTNLLIRVRLSMQTNQVGIYKYIYTCLYPILYLACGSLNRLLMQLQYESYIIFFSSGSRRAVPNI